MSYSKHFITLLLVCAPFFGGAQNEKGTVALSITASPFPTISAGSNDFGLIAKAGLEFHVSDKVSF